MNVDKFHFQTTAHLLFLFLIFFLHHLLRKATMEEKLLNFLFLQKHPVSLDMFEELFFPASGSLKSSSKALDSGWTPPPPHQKSKVELLFFHCGFPNSIQLTPRGFPATAAPTGPRARRTEETITNTAR